MGDDEITTTEAGVDAMTLNNDHDDHVDPWSVASKSDTGVDYEKLIRKYIANFGNSFYPTLFTNSIITYVNLFVNRTFRLFKN